MRGRVAAQLQRAALGALENMNGLTFLAGAGWCYLGVAEFSPRLAHVLAGVLLMAIGLVKYVRLKRKH